MCNDEDDCLDGTDEPSTCGELCVASGCCPCGFWLLPVWLGLAEPWSHPVSCHPSAVSPQVGAALYAMGAVQRRALTRTGECSAPAGLAGCCRRTGRAVRVRRAQGAHTASAAESGVS